MVRSLDSTLQSIDEGAGTEQLPNGGQRCSLRVSGLGGRRAIQIRPICRHQRARAVGQYEYEVQITSAMRPPEDCQRLPLKRMAPAHDGYPLRVALTLLVMGSVSCLPSTTSTMRS